MMNPHYKYVRTDYVYLDAKKAEGVTITRDDAPRIIKIFDDHSAKVNAEVDWKPTKNEYCNWCDAKQSQCRFSKKAG